MDEPVMGAWTTAGFVPPSVYIGFPLFVLPGTCPGEYRAPQDMPWGVLYDRLEDQSCQSGDQFSQVWTKALCSGSIQYLPHPGVYCTL